MSPDQIRKLAQMSGSTGGPANGLIFGFSVWGLLAACLFSGIGFVACMYGKSQGALKLMILGVLLMAYPYFIRSTLMLCVVGVALTAGLYVFRE